MLPTGLATRPLQAAMGVSAVTVRAWRQAFEADGLTDWGKVKPGRGRKATISEEKIAEIVELTTKTTPPGHTHWSCRTMAERVGVSPATVQRIWSELGLQPPPVDTFKVSNDPLFTEKLIDVVGLYLNPPRRQRCCAWTRSPRFRHWTAPGVIADEPTTTSATGPRPCSRRSMC